jgi:hypothetical protein
MTRPEVLVRGVPAQFRMLPVGEQRKIARRLEEHAKILRAQAAQDSLDVPISMFQHLVIHGSLAHAETGIPVSQSSSPSPTPSPLPDTFSRIIQKVPSPSSQAGKQNTKGSKAVVIDLSADLDQSLPLTVLNPPLFTEADLYLTSIPRVPRRRYLRGGSWVIAL